MGQGHPRDVGRLESSPGFPHMQGDIVRKSGEVSQRERLREGGEVIRQKVEFTPTMVPVQVHMEEVSGECLTGSHR